KFERSQFLENYAHNIILPSIENVVQAAHNLQKASADLSEKRSAESLNTAQSAWDETYSAWLKVNLLNFGPGGSEGRRRTILEEVGLWPIHLEGIEEKIQAEDFQLDDSKRNTRGLLAVEYLLFNDNPVGVLDSLQGYRRLDYLNQIIEKLVMQLDQFHKTWQNDYLTTFIQNDGIEVKSSTTLMFNEMVRSFEALRDVQLGIPMGLIAGQSGPQPELAEARFSKNSLKYLLASYKNLVSFWEGKKHTGEDGLGWEEYLLSVEGGAALVKTIQARLTAIDGIIERIPKDQNFEQLAVNNDPALSELYHEFKALTPHFKGESSSLLSLAITFSSGDGD
ncbi:MAG: imelysin family protein, partial [Bacteroidota bacterium]